VNARDQFGFGNKFIVPTVADGRVFVGTTNSVAVFGGLPAPASTTTVPAGWVNIISKNSGKCLDVQGGFQSDGAPVWQWTCWGGDNQKFWLTPVSGGYQITVKHSGLQMDVWGGPNATYDGAPLAQYPYGGSTNETFQVNPTADGYYILNPVNSGKCLDVQGGFQSDGAPVWQWTCWGGRQPKMVIQTRTVGDWGQPGAEFSASGETQNDSTGGEDTKRNLKHVKESQVCAVAVAELRQNKVLLAFSIARLSLAKAGDMWFLLAASLSRCLN
jgi:Ricin-type beta-trefoil lectin domain-like